MSRIALSLRQPWAWAVIHGGKTIENRRWNTRFRGEFLIHAAKGMGRDEYGDAVDFINDVRESLVIDWRANRVPDPIDLPRGGIVGRARLVDVIQPCRVGGERLCRHPWHMPDQFGFVLDGVEPVAFEPCVGKLGFFDPDVPGWRRPSFGDRS